MKKSELQQIIREEITKTLNEEKSELSGILFDISTLLDSLDNEQLQNKAGLNSEDSQLVRKSVDDMMKAMEGVKHLITFNKAKGPDSDRNAKSNKIKRIMKHIKTFESFISEKIDMSKAEIGQVTPYGEGVRTRSYGLKDGRLELSTLKFHEAKSVADKLKAAGFEAEAEQVRGADYDGYVHVTPPKAHDDIKKMAGIIEDTLGNILVNGDEKRVRETGEL